MSYKFSYFGRMLKLKFQSFFRHKAIKGGLWIFALKVVVQLLSVLRLAVLARLLDKKHFGMIGISLLAINILEALSKTGFEASLIRKQDDISKYLNTTWTINIVRGWCLFLIAAVAAPVLARVKIPEQDYLTAVFVIIAASFQIVIKSYSNIGLIYYDKELEFDKNFKIRTISSISDILI